MTNEPYELRRGAFKNLTLRVSATDGSLKVSAPWYVPKFVVDRFVAERAGWVADRRRSLADRGPEAGTDALRLWGVDYAVKVESPGRLPRVVVDSAARVLTLRVPAGWTEAQRKAVLDKWTKARVTEALDEAVPRWAAAMGLVPTRWTVKHLRSRWGSCRPDTGSLVFNAALGALPPACLDHVVVHELAHLVEAHHGPRFHALVDRYCPLTPEVRALLRGSSPAAGPAGPGGVPRTL